MKRYRISDQARADMRAIWLYVSAHNPAAADRLVERMVERFRQLAGRPNIGRGRDDLPGRPRSYAVGRYLIFYRPFKGGIEVLRVLSGERDLPAQFGDDD